jgi:hypothetical protein
LALGFLGGPWYSDAVEHVVLERIFDEPLTADDVRRMASEMSCLELYRVKPVRSYLMPDGRRLVCVFQAPDAEALRAVGRANRFPVDAVAWPSTVHTP